MLRVGQVIKHEEFPDRIFKIESISGFVIDNPYIHHVTVVHARNLATNVLCRFTKVHLISLAGVTYKNKEKRRA